MIINSVADLRRTATPVVLSLIWVLAALASLAAFETSLDVVGPIIVSTACAGFMTVVVLILKDTPLVRVMSGLMLMSEVSLLVANGGTWQTDMHMAYFAALAVLVVYVDVVVILAGAAAVAVHHLTLTYFLPWCVFPDGATFLRVIVHALILIVEAAALLATIYGLNRMFERSEKLLVEAQRATADAYESNRLTDEARQSLKMKDEQDNVSQLSRDRDRNAMPNAITAALDALAEKNFTYRMSEAVPPEFESLRENLNSTADALERAITSVNRSTTTIDQSVRQISEVTDDFVSRTERQAASLEETSASLEQVTHIVHSAAQSANQASVLVDRTRQEAERSGEIVQKAVVAISRIERSSADIGQIIGVIDEIAFQTSLLALNAGVEAARSGEAGRGFAVVAQEVRSLAQRSAASAKEIKALISTSTVEVAEGVRLVTLTVSALDKISSQVVEIDGVVKSLAAASAEQFQSLAEINTAVVAMDRDTQQNATMIEETTAATGELRRQVQGLIEVVQEFAVRGEGPPIEKRRRAA